MRITIQRRLELTKVTEICKNINVMHNKTSDLAWNNIFKNYRNFYFIIDALMEFSIQYTIDVVNNLIMFRKFI